MGHKAVEQEVVILYNDAFVSTGRQAHDVSAQGDILCLSELGHRAALQMAFCSLKSMPHTCARLLVLLMKPAVNLAHKS